MNGTMHLIAVDLSLDGPWAVGGVADIGDIDLPIVGPRDPARLYLPASSLVGSLRAHLGDDATRWFGPAPEPYRHDTGTKTLQPSLVRALGVVISSDDKKLASQSTAICGWSGAAEGGTLRSEQYLEAPSGQTRARWHLAVEQDAPVETLLDALRSWRPYIGRRRTSGFGTTRVATVHHTTLDLSSREHLTWWLSSRDSWFTSTSVGEELRATLPSGATFMSVAGTAENPQRLEFDLVLAEPLHIGTGRHELGSRARRETKPAAFTTAASGKPVIPGSTWKGLFRHRAQYIANVCGLAPELIGDMFGTVRETINNKPAGNRGVLHFHQSVVNTDDSPPPVRTHVAIDRITGGAVNGGLFSLHTVEHGTTRLVIDTTRTLRPAERALLLNVVRDLHDGLIGVGHAVTRGYGGMRLSDPTQLGSVRDRDLRPEGSTR